MRIFFLGLLLLTVCDNKAQTIQATDDTGRNIRLTQPAQRLISLAPHLTELVFSADAGDQLVGVSRYCDYPPRVKTLLQVSDYQTINYEQIALLQPDVILVWQAGLKAAVLKKLNTLAEAVYVSAPENFTDIARNLKTIGRLSGNPEIAARRADIFLDNITRLRDQYQTNRRLPVIYLLWINPLMTVNRNHWIGRLLNLCGGRNVYADMPAEVVKINRESLLLNQTALITHSITNTSVEWLPKSSVFITGALMQRPSLRIAEAAKEMCEIIADNR